MFATSDEMERDKLNEFTTPEGQVCAVAMVTVCCYGSCDGNGLRISQLVRLIKYHCKHFFNFFLKLHFGL